LHPLNCFIHPNQFLIMHVQIIILFVTSVIAIPVLQDTNNLMKRQCFIRPGEKGPICLDSGNTQWPGQPGPAYRVPPRSHKPLNELSTPTPKPPVYHSINKRQCAWDPVKNASSCVDPPGDLWWCDEHECIPYSEYEKRVQQKAPVSTGKASQYHPKPSSTSSKPKPSPTSTPYTPPNKPY
jgi:hypothetical protein